MFRTIELTNPHRKKHFDFFNGMDCPHFNICARVDIAVFLSFIKSNDFPFTPTMVYFIAKVANEIPAFRWRIRDNKIVEHDKVHPSFSVNTDEADVFSFCTVNYKEGFRQFLSDTLKIMEEMRDNPSFEDEEGRDDFLFLSAIPWIAFTGFEHAMHYSPADSVPRITWGKYQREGKKVWMPLAVQAHHAVVDGRHTGQYFQLFENYMANPMSVLD